MIMKKDSESKAYTMVTIIRMKGNKIFLNNEYRTK